MIQDIGEHSWRIEYQNVQADDSSKIMFFHNDTILVLHVGEDEFEIAYPSYNQVKEMCHDLFYLFMLDGITFFRQSLTGEELENLMSYLEEQGLKCSIEHRNFFRQVHPNAVALASITGMHLNGWYNKNKYCGACGSDLLPDSKERMLRCPSCNNMVFPRINPAVIVAVTYEDKILVTKYRGREYKNLALIAGFNEIGESLEETVRREVMEEAGIKVKNIRYYKSQPWGFTDNILVGYFCEAEGSTEISMDEEELSMAKWIDRTELPQNIESLSLTWEMIEQWGRGFN